LQEKEKDPHKAFPEAALPSRELRGGGGAAISPIGCVRKIAGAMKALK